MRGGGPEGAGASGGDAGDGTQDGMRGGRDSTRSAEMREMAQPPLMLLIEQNDSTVVLSERAQTIKVLVLGDMVTQGTAVEPQAPHYSAKWQGSELVAEHTGARGGKLTQTFDLGKDGKTLTIVTKRESQGGRPPLELKRVYDKYEGD
jgi:hypothetical protein